MKQAASLCFPSLHQSQHSLAQSSKRNACKYIKGSTDCKRRHTGLSEKYSIYVTKNMCRTQVTQVLFLVTCLKWGRLLRPTGDTDYNTPTILSAWLPPCARILLHRPRPKMHFTQKECLEDLWRDGTSIYRVASTCLFFCVCVRVGVFGGFSPHNLNRPPRFETRFPWARNDHTV